MIKKKNLLYLVLIFPFISPLNWSSSEIISSVHYVYKYISSIAIVPYCIYNYLTITGGKIIRNYNRINSWLIRDLFIVYYLIYVFNTYLQAEEYLELTVKACLPEIAFIILARQWLLYDENAFINYISQIFNIYVLLNLLFAVVSPSFFGTRQYDGRYIYLLGERNSLIYFLIPAIIFSVLNYEVNKTGKYIMYITSLACVVTIFLSGSSTAFAVAIICFLMLALFSNRYLFSNRILNVDIKGKFLYILYIVVWIIIILIQNASIFSFFIEVILGRNLTFTNRTLIWDKALLLIQESPIWGYGGYFVQHIRIEGWTMYTCHNFLLQNMVDSGIVSVLLLGLIIWLTVCRQDRLEQDRCMKILKIGVFAIFVSCLMEAYNMHYITLMLMYVWVLIDKKSEETEIKLEEMEREQ